MRPSKRRGWLRRSFRSVRPTRGFTVPDSQDRLGKSTQAVADAYYVLSDPQRRREYDRLSSSRPSSERTSDPNASGNFFRTFASMFSSGAGNGQAGTGTEQPGQRPNADHVFGDVFEEVTLLSSPPLSNVRRNRSPPSFFLLHPQLLRPEVERHLPLWSWLGAACGAGLGFITANVPGLVVGAYTGNRLGAIRDAKGKSVAAVFSELGGAQKAEVRRKRLRAARPNSASITPCLQILRALALKVLGVAFT
jgi:curved DNA-binding protein CbpA